ncbi:MAG: hypothetical protein J7M14_01890 [Planctomycetes bacterium]|nr:hypothetical protein [Planctomycetota bacterium]
MTFRAICLGLFGATALVVLGCLSQYFHVPGFIRGHFPVSVFGTMFIIVVCVNPLAYLISPKLRFTAKELGVALALVLVACALPDAGLMRCFNGMIVGPVRHNRDMSAWKRVNILSYAPSEMIVNDGKMDVDIIDGFMMGKGTVHKPVIDLSEVPWAAFKKPLTAWIPLVFLCSAAVICMSLIVHRQWTTREGLPYPIADFATEILRQDPARAMGPIFSNKMFWIGLLITLSIRTINGINTQYGEPHIIPMVLDFTPLQTRFDFIAKVPGAGHFSKPTLYPTAIAFGYFLATEVSLSMGLTGLFTTAVLGIMIGAGLDISGSYLTGGTKEWISFGCYLGAALMVLYVGRRYYWLVLKRAVTWRSSNEADASAAWACRFLLLSIAAITVLLSRHGLAWPLALAVTLLTLMFFLIIARVIAETGMFFLKPNWMVPGIMLGVLGTAAIGPRGTIIIGMLSIMWTAEGFECLIPFVTNGLRISHNLGVKTGRVGAGMTGVYGVGFLLAVFICIWADFSYGHVNWSQVGMNNAKLVFNDGVRAVDELAAREKLKESMNLTALQRITHMRVDRKFLRCAAIGLVAMLTISFLRLRLPWWPIHPVIFLGFATWSMTKYSTSFLLAWVIKSAVTKCGGRNAYQKGKNLMIGFIAGDLTGGVAFLAYSWIYFAVTGTSTPKYIIW